jgi:hypothetical protein
LEEGDVKLLHATLPVKLIQLLGCGIFCIDSFRLVPELIRLASGVLRLLRPTPAQSEVSYGLHPEI